MKKQELANIKRYSFIYSTFNLDLKNKIEYNIHPGKQIWG